MTLITPVLLAGGHGTRLWPLSRKSYPKQFSNLIGQHSLFQECALRLTSSNSVNFSSQITLTNADYRFIIEEQLNQIGVSPGSILIEPSLKNTAPAILAASIFAAKNEKDPILLVTPADHVIPDKQKFHNAISLAIPEVLKGNLVAFGVRPTKPETGYGYLEIDPTSAEVANVKNFIEKPEKELAIKMLNAEKFLWNAGIFMFKASSLISGFQKHAPDFIELVEIAVEKGKNDLSFFRLEPVAWNKLNNISIDYALMEKVDNLVAVPFKGDWSDLGDWDAVWSQSERDNDEVAINGNAHVINCKNTLLRSENDNQQIVGVGLSNIVAIAMPDAVLVADKNSSQDVKLAVSDLIKNKVEQAEVFPKDHRPWGWFESLALGARFQVKKIFVKPGGALSLQSHHHRSEHWIIVKGTAKVTVDDEVKLLGEGESIYIPLGSVHRMENPGKLPMVLIEVQTGSYLGEDDIVRYEDIYSRK